MSILAEMVSGKVDTSDLFAFIAMVLFVLAAILAAMAASVYVNPDPAATPAPRYAGHPASRWAATLAYAGLACLALALWVL